MTNILCIGGANIDRKIQARNRLDFGTSNPANSKISCGGVARNIAESLGRLGLKSALLALIGDDSEGNWLLENTKEYVDVSLTEIIQGKPTGTYTAVLDEQGEMAIALADMAIYDEINKDIMEGKWKLAHPEMILLDTNFPSAVIQQIMNHCRDRKIPLCIAPVSASKIEKLPDNLDGVTWFIANHIEAEAISKLELKSEGDFFRAAEIILKKGVDKVVITRGNKGLIYFTKAGEAGALLPTDVSVTDVTGAGDSLIAGILFGYLKGLNTEDACKIGLSCSVITIQSNETVNPALNKQNLIDAFQQYCFVGKILI